MKISIFLVASLFVISFVQSEIIIQSPKELKQWFIDNNRVIDFTIANFGFVPYGKTLTGQLVYPQVEGNASYALGCVPLEEVSALNYDYESWTQGVKKLPIIMVDRGNCSFVNKAYNIANSGASMALIADFVEENYDNFVMIDDNHLNQLHIPTVMIHKTDADKIKEYINETTDVILQVRFPAPTQHDTIKYELYFSSLDWQAYMFLDHFWDINKDLENDHLSFFEPHYVMFPCIGCHDSITNEIPPNCLSGGRYCSIYSGRQEANGNETLREAIRQICIFQNYPDKWWNYMGKFFAYCLVLKEEEIEECSWNMQKQANIDVEIITECYVNSWEGPEESLDDNKILAAELQYYQESNIQEWPDLKVNDRHFRGDITERDAVWEYICSAFSKMPEICDKWKEEKKESTVRPLKPNSKSDIPGLSPQENSSQSLYVFLGFVLLTFMIIMIFFYRRMQRKNLNSELALQVSSAVSQYYALKDQSEVK